MTGEAYALGTSSRLYVCTFIATTISDFGCAARGDLFHLVPSIMYVLVIYFISSLGRPNIALGNDSNQTPGTQ